MVLPKIDSRPPTGRGRFCRALGLFFPGALMAGALAVNANFQVASAAGARRLQIVQAATGSDENEVAPAQVEKYVAVYQAMQRDRSLTVDAAAAANGMTLDAFRALESRVQRDEAALQRVRDQLQASAKQPQPTKSP